MPEERLSRSNRRKLEYANKRVASMAKGFQTVRLTELETVLGHEDELGFLERQGTIYREALTYDRTRIKIFRAFRDLGLNEGSLRRIYFDPVGKNPILAEEFSQMDASKLNVLRDVGSSIFSIVRNKKQYNDEDDDEIDELLSSGTDIPIIELLADKTFRMSENVALLSLQIDWLREKKRVERKAKMRSAKKPQVSAQALSEGGRGNFTRYRK